MGLRKQLLRKSTENQTKFWRTDNNVQPIQTSETKNLIGRWTLGNAQNIHGGHLSETREIHDYVCCDAFHLPRNELEKNTQPGSIVMVQLKIDLFNTRNLQKGDRKRNKKYR